MKEEFGKNIAKGVIIGVANIIPGVSGGTLAVSMGIYDKIIGSVTGIFSDTKNSIKTLFPYAVGMGIGIVCLSFMIEWLFAGFPFQTNMLFIGLIVGCLPVINKNLKGEKMKLKYIAAFLILFLLVTATSLMGNQSGKPAELSAAPLSLVKLFFAGVIASATMVIPGVSGSMILSVMGYYLPVIEKINQFIMAVLHFDMPHILSLAVVLAPFGLGVLLGIFLIAKLIELIFAKERILAYCGILGLILASPLAMLMTSGVRSVTITEGLTGIVALLAGGLAANRLGEA